MPDASLPESLREIAELVGVDGAMALARRWGGRRLYVPTVMPDITHPIADVLGLDKAHALAACFGGQRLLIPQAAAFQRLQRDQEIERQHADGVPVSEIAERFGVSERQVFAILARVRGSGERRNGQ